jgi:hypothetical protein
MSPHYADLPKRLGGQPPLPRRDIDGEADENVIHEGKDTGAVEDDGYIT